MEYNENRRVAAMNWWNALSDNEQANLKLKYGIGVSGREIQIIWEAESN